jgi:hypothetical protein
MIMAENGLISVLCPSRGRPDRLKTMMQSALSTAKDPENIEFCVWIDFDDDSYKELIDGNEFKNLRILRGPRVALSSMYNGLLLVASGDFFLWVGDDVEFRTNSWDKIIVDAMNKFENKIGLVYVNDLGKYEQKHANIGMLHRNWVETLGFILTPHLRDNGPDAWISDVARQVNRCTYLKSVEIEHMQHRQGKAKLDKTYSDRDLVHQWYEPFDLYHLLKDERRREALYMASQWPNIKIKFKFRYLLATFYVMTMERISGMSKLRAVYFGSFSNSKFVSRSFDRFLLRSRRRWE